MQKLIIVFFLMSLNIISSGQEMVGEEKRKSFSLHIVEEYRFDDSGGFDESGFSKLGIEGQVTFHLTDVFGLQFKGGWTKWSKNRETYIPLRFGPEYTFLNSPNLQLTVYGNIGPSLTIGNDYAGIFAAAESGLQITSRRKKGILIGLGWGLNTAFHPSEFSVLKGTVGWRF